MDLTTAPAFDAAYQILRHPGKCAHRRGHTYHLEVTVGAEQLDRLDRWDHTTLLWSQDPPTAAIAQVQAEAPEKVVRLPGDSTVELFAREAGQAMSQRTSLPGSCSNAW